MYLEFYKFRQKPFQINTDPKLYWFGKNNTKAFNLFISGLSDKKGISLLTGDSGTGKTTFVNLLVSKLPCSYITGTIHDPSFSELDFSRYLAHVFNLQTDFETLKDFHILFKDFLLNAHTQNKSVLLVVDETQKLSKKILNIIITLSELKYKKTPLISVLLVGQSNTLPILMQSKKTLKKKLKVKYQLQFLSEAETNDYIQFRLNASGIRARLFTRGAIKRIFRLSKGSPLKINTIADYALLSGYIAETRHINETHVDRFTNSFDKHPTDITPAVPNSPGTLRFSSNKQLLKNDSPLDSKEIPDINVVSPLTNPVSQNLFRFHSQDLRVLTQMARFYIENKNPEEAELYIEKILECKEEVADTLMMKGEIHILRNEYRSAIKIFDHILAKNPRNVHSYYFKALAHIEKSEFITAKTALGTALSINPKFNKGKYLLQKINNTHPVKA